MTHNKVTAVDWSPQHRKLVCLVSAIQDELLRNYNLRLAGITIPHRLVSPELSSFGGRIEFLEIYGVPIDRNLHPLDDSITINTS